MSRRHSACIILGVLVAGAGARRSAAQVEPDDTVRVLRSKPELTSDDLTVLDNHIESLLKNFESDRADPKAANRLREQLLSIFGHPENSPSFTRRVAERCALRMESRAMGSDWVVGLAMVYGLEALPDVGTLPGLKAALKSPDEAVRVLAMRAVINLRPRIETDPAVMEDVLRWLQDVGSRETSPLVLRRIYQATELGSKQDAPIAALIAILEARLQGYEEGNASSVPADLAAYQRLIALSSTMSEADKKRLVGIIARYLTIHTYRYLYVDMGSAKRGEVHRLVFLAERLLMALTGLTPEQGGVSAACASVESERSTRIRSSLESWVGSREKPGALSAAPWQVPSGAGSNLDFAAPVPEYPEDPPAQR